MVTKKRIIEYDIPEYYGKSRVLLLVRTEFYQT